MNEGLVDDDARNRTRLSLIDEAGWSHAAHDSRDFVFVEDAVSAIITAMQYKPTENSPTTFNIGSGEMSSLSEAIETLVPDGARPPKTSGMIKSMIDVEQEDAARSAVSDSKEYLRWSAKTAMKDGAAKLLAWHLDRALPFFPPPNANRTTVVSPPKLVDGKDILSHRGLAPCSENKDESCLREAHSSFPCLSECSSGTCEASVFDNVLPLIKYMTDGCDIVMYTMSLGYNVTELTLETEYQDGEAQEKRRDAVTCNLAFVPSESGIVREVINKVPPVALKKLDLTPETSFANKVKFLNGHLVHKGWMLIFVYDAVEPLTAEDTLLLKHSPGRIFHDSVKYAMYVEENFDISPNAEDAQFLAYEMIRGQKKKRTTMGPNHDGEPVKYKLPAEPERRAVMLVAPMKGLPKWSKSLPLREAMAPMIIELGDDPDEKESKEVRTQREYYERAKGFINSMDLRPPSYLAHYRLEIKDFVRSRWVVHDLKLEEARQLRCEWYQEHLRWGTQLDQLSFAFVMAKRELMRKIVTEQLPEAKQTFEERVTEYLTDANEWHPFYSGEGITTGVHYSQVLPEAIPENLRDQPDNEVAEKPVDTESVRDDESTTLYVRIISDRIMLEERKKWIGGPTRRNRKTQN